MFGQETERREHLRFFQRVEDIIEAGEQAERAFAGAEAHVRSAFDHAHNDARGHAVAGNVGDVGDPIRL